MLPVNGLLLMKSFICKWACCARRSIGSRWRPGASRLRRVAGGALESLPFTLTNAQQKRAQRYPPDLDSGKPMNRLLQGDVGSGKTVVAALAAAIIAATARKLRSCHPPPFLRNSIIATSRCLPAKTQSCSQGRSVCWSVTRRSPKRK